MGLGSSLGLGITIKGTDEASGPLNQVGRSFSNLADKAKNTVVNLNDSLRYMQDMGKKIAGAGLGMLGAFTGAASATGIFDKQVVKTGLIAQATSTELKALRNAAIDAGIATQFSPLEAAQGLEQLASQGFNAKDSIRALIPALDLAAGGSIGVEQATAAMTSAVKVFGLDVKDAGLAADKMLKIANATALSAKDLELAMGTVGRGASIAKQSLDEMLPSIGLVKNTGVDASVAASSVSSALVHMGTAAKEFKKLGISVTDAKGQFRPFMDVVLETESILSKKFPNAAQKVEHAEKLFSRFGLTAYSAITTQLGKGITDAEGKLYQGAAGVAFLRKEMETAAGTAAQFRDKLLNTYEGQKTLMRGSIETAKIMLGEGFAAAFKPIVATAVSLLNKFIEIMRQIPEPVKKAMAVVATVGAGFITVVGSTIAVVAAVKLAALGFAALGISLSAFLAPFALVAGALVLVGATIGIVSYGIKQNVGGIGDTFKLAYGKVKLSIDALKQLFSQGGFSGDVLKELDRAENQGVKKFAVAVWSNALRLKNFISEAWTSLKGWLKDMEPAFQALGSALWDLGRALGFVDKNDPDKNRQSWNSWADAGRVLGKVIGAVAEFIVRDLTMAIKVATPAVQLLRDLWKSMGDDMEKMTTEFGKVRREFAEANKVTVQHGGGVDDLIERYLTWGNVSKAVVWTISSTVDMLKEPFRWLGNAISSGIQSFAILGSTIDNVMQGIADVFGGLFEMNWARMWEGAKRIAFGVINSIVQMSLGFVEMLAKIIDKLVSMADRAGSMIGLGKIGSKFLGPSPSKLVQDFRLGAQASLYKAMGLEEPPAPRAAATPEEKAAGGLTPLEELAGYGTPFERPKYLRDEKARQDLESELTRARRQVANPAAEGAAAGVPISDYRTELEKALANQEFNVTANLYIDGDRVTQTVLKGLREQGIRSHEPAPVGEY